MADRTVYFHLDAVWRSPFLQLDEFLLQTIDADYLMPTLHRYQLFSACRRILPTLKQPYPVILLMHTLSRQTSVKFSDTHALSIDFKRAFDPRSSTRTQRLIFEMLYIAKDSLVEIGLIAARRDVVRAWIVLWLTTLDEGVSDDAGRVLKDFITSGIDVDGVSTIASTVMDNPIIDVVFKDPEIYGLIFEKCSLPTASRAGQHDPQQLARARARLLDFVVDIDHVVSPARFSCNQVVEQLYGLVDPRYGLLHFAFLRMVSFHDPDNMMLSTYVNACKRYLEHEYLSSGRRSLFAREFLEDNGIHQKCAQYWLYPHSTHASWMEGISCRYVARYCELWGRDLMNEPSFQRFSSIIQERLYQHFGLASPHEWDWGNSLEDSMLVLSCLPRLLHLEQAQSPALFNVRANASSMCVINMLTRVFCEAPVTDPEEQMAARALYFKFLMAKAPLWPTILNVAREVANSDAALAAIRFVDSFILAAWLPLPLGVAGRIPQLPEEAQLCQELSHGSPLPLTGLDALITDMTTGGMVLEYLLEAPRGHLTGQLGAGGEDIKVHDLRVAEAKHAFASKLCRHLQTLPRPDLGVLVAAIERKVALGPVVGIEFGRVPGEIFAS